MKNEKDVNKKKEKEREVFFRIDIDTERKICRIYDNKQIDAIDYDDDDNSKIKIKKKPVDGSDDLSKNNKEPITTIKYNDGDDLQKILRYSKLNGKVKIYKYQEFLIFYSRKLMCEGKCEYGKCNGKWKVYWDNGRLKFEGEYKNGLRSGKGKEYNYNGRLKFECEFLKGEANGKGKEYYYNGDIKFEGEYENGLRSGKGKEYNYNGRLKFECEFLKGEANGKGKEFYDNGKIRYEGEYKNGKRNGKGKEFYENGKLKFDGIYYNNLEKVGIEKEYYENGNIKFEREYSRFWKKDLILDNKHDCSPTWMCKETRYDEYGEIIYSENKCINNNSSINLEKNKQEEDCCVIF